jgi:hypothetical protein
MTRDEAERRRWGFFNSLLGLVFRWPEGKVIPACPERIPINEEAGETLKKANRGFGLALSAQTVDSFWDGEVMDLHMAVDGVLDCEDDPT